MKPVIVHGHGPAHQIQTVRDRLLNGVHRRHQPQGVARRLACLFIGGKGFIIESGIEIGGRRDAAIHGRFRIG